MLVALAACSSTTTTTAGPVTTAAPAAPPTSSASVPAALVGSWTRVITAEDWKHAGGYPAGTWTIKVSRDGAVAVFLPHGTDPDFVTHFTVTGAQLTIGDSPVCRPAADRYRWRASPGSLTIVVVADDGCRPRAVLFGGTWRRSG